MVWDRGTHTSVAPQSGLAGPGLNVNMPGHQKEVIGPGREARAE